MKKVFTVLLIGISGLPISGCDWLFWDDDENEQENYADWDLLVSQYPVLKAYPAFAGQITFLGYTTDHLFYESVTISTKDSYANNYFKVLKNNGFKNSTASHNYTQQLMSSNKLGAYWRYVGFDASNTSGWTDVVFFNIK